jgi:predicted Co/Zn/Cd cation transporter (cation efflux family)
MSCRDKLIPTLVIFYILALVGFLIDSIFIVPIYTECTYLSQIPEDALVDLSMSDWIMDNMIAGIVLFSLMASFGRNKRASSDCMLVVFLVIFTLYCLF